MNLCLDKRSQTFSLDSALTWNFSFFLRMCHWIETMTAECRCGKSNLWSWRKKISPPSLGFGSLTKLTQVCHIIISHLFAMKVSTQPHCLFAKNSFVNIRFNYLLCLHELITLRSLSLLLLPLWWLKMYHCRVYKDEYFGLNRYQYVSNHELRRQSVQQNCLLMGKRLMA